MTGDRGQGTGDGGAEALADLERELGGAVAETRALAPDDASFAVDGLRPRLVCTPTSVDELSSAVRVAGAAGAAVTPWGGGTRMALGLPPRAVDLVVRTTRLSEWSSTSRPT